VSKNLKSAQQKFSAQTELSQLHWVIRTVTVELSSWVLSSLSAWPESRTVCLLIDVHVGLRLATDCSYAAALAHLRHIRTGCRRTNGRLLPLWKSCGIHKKTFNVYVKSWISVLFETLWSAVVVFRCKNRNWLPWVAMYIGRRLFHSLSQHRPVRLFHVNSCLQKQCILER